MVTDSRSDSVPNGTPMADQVMTFGAFRLDPAARELKRGDDGIALPPKVFDTLLVLVRNGGRIVKKDELISAVWPDSFVSDDSLTQNIWTLRRALGDDTNQPAFIATIPRHGYRFIADVRHAADAIPTDHVEARSGSGGTAARVIAAPPVPAILPPRYGAWSRPALWTAIGLVVGLSAAVIGPLFVAAPALHANVPVRFTQDAPEGTTLAAGVALSPDGRTLAFVARDASSNTSALWVRALDTGKVRVLPGTEGARQPFWSPNGRAIAFFASGRLKIADMSGGAPTTIATVGENAVGGSWQRDDLIVFAPWLSGLFAVSASGGATRPISTLAPEGQESSHRWPEFLPDGRHFLYVVTSANPSRAGTYVGSLDSHERVRLFDSSIVAVTFAPPKHLVYLNADVLMARPFDTSNLAFAGPPVRVAGDIVRPGFLVRPGIAASAAGLLALSGGANPETIAAFNRAGRRLGALDVPGPLFNPVLSPDGTQLVATGRGEQAGLWLVDLLRGTSMRVVPDGLSAVWAPDGSQIAFGANRIGGISNLYRRSLTGAPVDEPLLTSRETKVLNDWSRDNRHVVYVSSTGQMTRDLWVLPLFGERKPFPYLRTGFNHIQAQISPDGHWLAYASDESGRWEVYTQSFPTPGRKRTISTAGGVEPKWRRDGKELFYLAADHTLMSVEVKGGDPAAGVGLPRPLFRASMSGDLADYRHRYAVSDDGGRFFVHSVEDGRRAPISVVVNWPALIAREPATVGH